MKTAILDEAYPIMNYSFLWWILIAVIAVIIAAFYVLTLQLTRPLRGEDDDIFIKKTNKYTRHGFLNEVHLVKDNITKNQTTLEEAVGTLYDITQRFIATKTKTNLTGMTLTDLKKGKAPQPVIDIYEELYALSYDDKTDNKAVPFFQLAQRLEDVILTWR